MLALAWMDSIQTTADNTATAGISIETGAAVCSGIEGAALQEEQAVVSLGSPVSLTHALCIQDLEGVDAHSWGHTHQAAVVILGPNDASNMRAVACRQ
jgi:hypothetical protein